MLGGRLPVGVPSTELRESSPDSRLASSPHLKPPELSTQSGSLPCHAVRCSVRLLTGALFLMSCTCAEVGVCSQLCPERLAWAQHTEVIGECPRTTEGAHCGVACVVCGRCVCDALAPVFEVERVV